MFLSKQKRTGWELLTLYLQVFGHLNHTDSPHRSSPYDSIIVSRDKDCQRKNLENQVGSLTTATSSPTVAEVSGIAVLPLIAATILVNRQFQVRRYFVAVRFGSPARDPVGLPNRNWHQERSRQGFYSSGLSWSNGFGL